MCYKIEEKQNVNCYKEFYINGNSTQIKIVRENFPLFRKCTKIYKYLLFIREPHSLYDKRIFIITSLMNYLHFPQ